MMLLGLGNPTTLPAATAAGKSISHCLSIPARSIALETHRHHFHVSTTPVAASLLRKPGRNSFSVFASNKRGKVHAGGRVRGGLVMEMSDFEDEDEDEFVDDDEELDEEQDVEEEEGEEEDDVRMFLPFGKMKKWLENKPRGFGEGKVYDTSIEDKLLDEMEQSRKAQAANINKLKNNPVPAKNGAKKDDYGKKDGISPSGIRVRVTNVPKKKNVHRDLKLAFKDVPGIVDIVPAVTGNKKTKDPICKGFAFVYLKSEEEASRFVLLFSGQSITFGKVQKQIKCEMANSETCSASEDELAGRYHSVAQLDPDMEGDFGADFNMDDSSFEDYALHLADDHGEIVESELEDAKDNVKSFSVAEVNGNDKMELRMEALTSSFPSKKSVKNQASKKKVTTMGSRVKIPKLEIPGSAKRLKIKEKAVLTDVFSKYGSQTALASKEER